MRSYSCCDNNSAASEDIGNLSGLLKIVAEQNRLRLLCILRDGGEHCVCEFEEHTTDLSQSLISHHLADLKNAGLVTAEKRGLKMHYVLSEQGQHVVETIFSLTNKGEKMDEVTKQGCCSSGAADVIDESTPKDNNDKCCEGNNCKDNTCKRKDIKDENRSCRNGLCNVSATPQNNAAGCC